MVCGVWIIAILNHFPVTVPWDVASFANATSPHHIPTGTPLAPALVDRKLMSGFPTPELGPFKKPTTQVDCHGRILVWYLPGALGSTANVRSYPQPKLETLLTYP